VNCLALGGLAATNAIPTSPSRSAAARASTARARGWLHGGVSARSVWCPKTLWEGGLARAQVLGVLAPAEIRL
jgi:hypothetical protein